MNFQKKRSAKTNHHNFSEVLGGGYTLPKLLLGRVMFRINELSSVSEVPY